MTDSPTSLLPYQNPVYQKLVISRIEQETNQTKIFFLKTQNGEKLEYRAGQYLTFIHPTLQPEVRRSYSITSVPDLGEQIAIGVKRVPNGLFSRHFYDQAKPGDEVITTGAGGVFTLPEETSTYKQIFLFAAGVGITPIFALLKSILFTKPDLKVVLVFSNSNPARAIFRTTLEQLAEQFKGRFVLEMLYSDSPDLSRARLYPDLLISLLKKHAIAEPEFLLSYICGPINYQRMCTYGLRRAGVPAESIRKENFITDDPKPLSLPPDTDAHNVTIKFKGKETRVEVKYPETILQAASRAGLNLPYSCAAGVCGNCLAKCTQGKIWMSYNEVLTDGYLEKGWILSCVGHPVGGDAVVEIGV